MSILIWLILLIVLGFAGFTTTSEVSECVGADDENCYVVEDSSWWWQGVEVDGISGVIVVSEDGYQFVSAESYWTPDIPDIELAEAALERDQGRLDHFRQYVGFNDSGMKIYINGFCDPAGIDWYSEPVLLADGGDCYFEAVYNIETDDIESFRFNGEA
jgi:hypothetical protein